jgi:hypothetical protein
MVDDQPGWMKVIMVIVAGVVIGGGALASVLFKMSQRRALVAPLRREIAALREDLEHLREEVERLKSRLSGTVPTNGIREMKP